MTGIGSVRRTSAFVVLAALGAAVLGLGLPALAASETGDVFWISDGDTYTVDRDGGSDIRVRMTGMNAMETGACWASQAQNRLSQLILNDNVTLTYEKDTLSGDRHWRWTKHPSTGDVGYDLLQEGLVLPFPHQTETGKNLTYMKAATTAAANNVGLWDSNDCGSGPYQSYKIKLWVNWDADGTDGSNINGEFVRIKNYGSGTVSLKDWWLRDSGTHQYWYFPDSASIPSGGSIRVYMGNGSNSSSRLYAKFSTPVFENIDRTGDTVQGDGAYLFDPDGDLRAYMMYPCVQSCSDSLEGKISVSAVYDPSGADSDNINGEYVRIKNISSSSIYMSGYVLESYPYVYDFYVRGVSSRIGPGETMHVHAGTGGDTRLERHWDKTKAILDNGGDYALVRSHDNISIDCYDWGSVSC